LIFYLSWPIKTREQPPYLALNRCRSGRIRGELLLVLLLQDLKSPKQGLGVVRVGMLLLLFKTSKEAATGPTN